MTQSSKSVRPQVLRRSKMLTEGSSFCCYGNRVCMQMRIEGYDYCARHILEDKNCPFKQCQYISDKTSKRCTNAVLRMDKRDGYCTEHTRQAALMKYHSSRKRKPKESPELLLEELDHYNPKSSGSNAAEQKKSKLYESAASKIIEYLSSSDSEAEPLTMEQTWYGDGDSDAESVDSEQEDPLKHAGVYTAEEVALITRDKLIRLQSLYIDQFKWLQHEMKEKRRRYLHTVCREREALGGIRYAKEDPEQRNKYEELVAMKRYHRRYGQEALLHRQSKERRIAVSEGINYRPPSYPKCIHSRNGMKCGARTVPLSKYCIEHILSDPHQVLFKPCNYASQCRRPVVLVSDCTTCVYHTEPKTVEYRLLMNNDEKDDSKLEIDVVGDTKQEEPHQSLQLQLQLQKQLATNTPVTNIKSQPNENASRVIQAHIRVIPPNSSTALKAPYQRSRDSPTPADMKRPVPVQSPFTSRLSNVSHPTVDVAEKAKPQSDSKRPKTSIVLRIGMVGSGSQQGPAIALQRRSQSSAPSGGIQVGALNSVKLPIGEVPQVVSDLLEMEKHHQQLGPGKQVLLMLKDGTQMKDEGASSASTSTTSKEGDVEGGVVGRETGQEQSSEGDDVEKRRTVEKKHDDPESNTGDS